jgi:phosphate uptake regulator
MKRSAKPSAPLAEPGGRGPVPPPPVHRIVQRSGPTTLVVSLPMEWTRAESVGPGSSVTWRYEEDGGLSLHTERQSAAPPGAREFHLRARGRLRSEPATRVLFSCYTLGYDRVRFEDPRGLSDEVRHELERATAELLGFSLTDSTTTAVVATSFLDPAAHPVDEVVSRMGFALDQLLEMIVANLDGTGAGPLTRARSLRLEVRRLLALTLRQLNLAARNPGLASRLGLRRSSHLLGTRVVTVLLDEIAQAAVHFAEALPRPPTSRHARGSWPRELRVRLEELRARLRESLGAFRSGQPEDAGRVLQRLAQDRRRPGRASSPHGPRAAGALGTTLSRCTWWIDLAGEYAAAIADAAFTRAVGDASATAHLD